MRHTTRTLMGMLVVLVSSATVAHAGQATRRDTESAQVRRAVRVERPTSLAGTGQREVTQVRRAVRETSSQVRSPRNRTAGRAGQAVREVQRPVTPRPGQGTRSRTGAAPRGRRSGGVTTRGYIRRGTGDRRGSFGAGVGIRSGFGGSVRYNRYPSRYRSRYGGRRYGSRYSYGGYGYGAYGYGYPSYYGYSGYGPYSYRAGYGYGYGYGGSNRYLGALRLQVRPRHAEVFVDGYYAGQVDDFDGTFQRLRLEEGTYEIAVEAPGYEALVFDVRLLPGQTVRYRGELRPLP